MRKLEMCVKSIAICLSGKLRCGNEHNVRLQIGCQSFWRFVSDLLLRYYLLCSQLAFRSLLQQREDMDSERFIVLVL